MPAPPDPALVRVYERAIYEVEFPAGTVAFRVGAGPPFEPPFVILTAFNPGHERPSPAANEEANDRLRGLLESRDLSWFPARGMNAARTHVESSLAVPDLPLDEALAIAREFRQAAVFVWDGHRGANAWC